MTEKCKFYESNPTQECRLTRDVCELAHCGSHNYRKDCFIYGVRHVYLKQQASEKRAFQRARVSRLKQ